MATTPVEGTAPVERDEDHCAVCGDPIPERTVDGAKAHWGGPGDAVIVDWTCSPACAEAYATERRSVG